MNRPDVKAFFDEATNTFSYVAWDPATRHAAVIDSVLDYDAAAGRIQIDGQEVKVSRGLNGLAAGAAQAFALRPEAVTLGEGGNGRNRLRGTIDQVSFLGSVVRIRVRLKDNAILLDTFNNPNLTPPEFGSAVAVNFGTEDLLVLEGS